MTFAVMSLAMTHIRRLSRTIPTTLLILLAISINAQATEGRSRAARRDSSKSLERILLPFIGEMSEHPHYWLTEFWARNDSSRPLAFFFPFPCQLGTGCPPLSLQVFAPGQLIRNPTYAGNQGVFLHLEHGALREISYTLRVEDVAGLQEIVAFRSLRGTELPLVRESEFRTAVHLLNIPAAGGGALRKVLRIYQLGTSGTEVTVRLNSMEFDREIPITELPVLLRPGRQESGYDAYPGFGFVDLTDLISGTESEIAQGRVAVWIESADPNQRLWAFISLIDVSKRQLTTITPGR